MSDLICVTNRHLCQGDFLSRIDNIAACHPAGILLREKDLPEAEYESLARQVLDICRTHGVLCILHSFAEVARTLGAKALHLPLPILRELTPAQRAAFVHLGASCHSVADAQEAQRLGCTYLTAGHIFATGCKQGVPGRGLDFLQAIIQAVELPVYAIGGIGPQNAAQVRMIGAKGLCVMSGAMTCPDIHTYLNGMEG